MTDEVRVYPELDSFYPDWHQMAACTGAPQDRFFGDDLNNKSMSSKQIRDIAGQYCSVCPVFEECLRQALENDEEYGIWAGTSGRTRKAMQVMIAQGETTVDQLVEDYSHGFRAAVAGAAPRLSA